MTSLRAAAKPFIPGGSISTSPSTSTTTSNNNSPNTINKSNNRMHMNNNIIPNISFTNNGVINPNDTNTTSVSSTAKRLSANAREFIPPTHNTAAPASVPQPSNDNTKQSAPSPAVTSTPVPPQSSGATDPATTSNSTAAAAAAADNKPRNNSLVAELRKVFEPNDVNSNKATTIKPPATQPTTLATPAAAPTPSPHTATIKSNTNEVSNKSEVPESATTPSVDTSSNDLVAAAKAKKLQGLGLPLNTAPIRHTTTTTADQRIRKLRDDTADKTKQFKNLSLISNDVSTSVPIATGDKIIYDVDVLLDIRELYYGELDDTIKTQLPDGIIIGSGDIQAVHKAGATWKDSKEQSVRASQSIRNQNHSISNNINDSNKSLDRNMMGTITQKDNINNDNNNNNKNKPGKRNKPRGDQPMDIEITPLEQSANAYKLLRDVPADIALMRSVNSILNKLTPTKFDILVQQIIELNISSAALLRDVVNSLFEKAVAEPTFSPTYAQFSVHLSDKLPTFTDADTGDITTFKRLLLNTCQNEFENTTQSDNNTDNTIELSDIDKSHIESKRKLRQLGTIQFIGELYSRRMLAAGIMRMCIVLLLGDINSPDEPQIEVLCKLLSTIGSTLDIQNNTDAQSFLNATFDALEKLKKSELLSSRIRFMITDIIELRQRGWVHRIKQDTQKTLSEIQAESGIARNNNTQSINLLGSQSGGVRNTSKSMLGVGSKLTSQQRSNVGKFDRYNIKPNIKQNEVVKMEASNVYGMLDQGDDNESDEQYNNNTTIPSTRTVQPSKPVYNEQSAIQSLKSILSDYDSTHDQDDVLLSLNALPSEFTPDNIIYHILLQSYEYKETRRETTIKLLMYVYQKQYTQNDYLNALHQVFKNADDFSLDNPHIFNGISYTLAQYIIHNICTLQYINQQHQLLFPSSAAQIAVNTIVLLNKLQSQAYLIQHINSCQFTMNELLDEHYDSKKVKNKLKHFELDAIINIIL